ncbi:Telomeric repeat-binding factor 2 [Aerococcus viridans]|nr:Telomeric repeat-binding factor 2 [Aerococcus viridans]
MKKLLLLGMSAFVLGACDSASSNEPTEAQKSSTEQTESSTKQAEETSTDSEQGKRSNPYTLADTFEMDVQYSDPDSDDYTPIDGRIKVTFNNVTTGQEAQDFLTSENEFNDQAPEGFQWMIFDTSVELLKGSEEVPFNLFLTEQIYDTDGASVDNSEHMAFSNNQLSDQSIFPGATAQGNIVLLVPEDTNGVLMEISYLAGGDTVYIDLSE